MRVFFRDYSSRWAEWIDAQSPRLSAGWPDGEVSEWSDFGTRTIRTHLVNGGSTVQSLLDAAGRGLAVRRQRRDALRHALQHAFCLLPALLPIIVDFVLL